MIAESGAVLIIGPLKGLACSDGSAACGLAIPRSGGLGSDESAVCLTSDTVLGSGCSGTGYGSCGEVFSGSLGTGVGVAGTYAGAIRDPGEADRDGLGPRSWDTKADAVLSALGGSKAPYSSGRQPFQAGSTRDKSAGSERYTGGILLWKGP